MTPLRSSAGLRLNGHPQHRLPNTLHVSFPGVSGRALLAAVADTVAASVGSAYHSELDAVSSVATNDKKVNRRGSFSLPPRSG